MAERRFQDSQDKEDEKNNSKVKKLMVKRKQREILKILIILKSAFRPTMFSPCPVSALFTHISFNQLLNSIT